MTEQDDPAAYERLSTPHFRRLLIGTCGGNMVVFLIAAVGGGFTVAGWFLLACLSGANCALLSIAVAAGR